MRSNIQTIAPSSLHQIRDPTTDLDLKGSFPAREARHQGSTSSRRLVVLTARSSVSLKPTVQHRARSLTRQLAHSGWTLELGVCSFVFHSSQSSPWYMTSPARFAWSLQHPHLDNLESPVCRSTLLQVISTVGCRGSKVQMSLGRPFDLSTGRGGGIKSSLDALFLLPPDELGSIYSPWSMSVPLSCPLAETNLLTTFSWVNSRTRVTERCGCVSPTHLSSFELADLFFAALVRSPPETSTRMSVGLVKSGLPVRVLT